MVWEEVESRTSEQVELSGTYAVFIVLAGLIAAVGIFLNSSILIVGAMVVGPEFGPIAGFCVAFVQRRRHLAARSLVALAAGFSLAITAVHLTTHVFRITGLTPTEFTEHSHSLSNVIDPEAARSRADQDRRDRVSGVHTLGAAERRSSIAA